MTYVQLLLAGTGCMLISGGLFVGAGLLNRRAGYDSSWQGACTLMGLLTFLLAGSLTFLLLPYITLVVLACFGLGLLLLVAGVVRLLLS